MESFIAHHFGMFSIAKYQCVNTNCVVLRFLSVPEITSESHHWWYREIPRGKSGKTHELEESEEQPQGSTELRSAKPWKIDCAASMCAQGTIVTAILLLLAALGCWC